MYKITEQKSEKIEKISKQGLIATIIAIVLILAMGIAMLFTEGYDWLYLIGVLSTAIAHTIYLDIKKKEKTDILED